MKTKKRQAEHLAKEAAAAGVTVPPAVREWWDKGAAYATPRVEQAREWAGPRIDQAREWAGPRLEHARDRSVEIAAPRIEAAAGRLVPAVDATRDKIVDDVLPKVIAAAQTAVAKAEHARDERLGGAGDVLRGKAVAVRKPSRRRRVARVFLVLSALGALAAAVVVVLRRRSSEVDPWAQPYPAYPPIGDPSPVPPVTGGDDLPDEQQPETDVLSSDPALGNGLLPDVPGQPDATTRNDS